MIWAAILCGAASPALQTDLVILAAASLKAPLTEMAIELEKQNPELHLHFSFAGSQELAAQINLGAPADVFFSADKAQMDVIVKAGNADSKRVSAFASNKLALLVSKSAKEKVNGIADLAKDGIKISLASETVPVGAYSRTALKKASAKLGTTWLNNVFSHVVSSESSVSAIFSRVEMDEVDAGIVYHTDAMRAQNSAARVIPDDWNVKAKYFVVVPNSSTHPSESQAVVKFALSKSGQKILAKSGFLPPK